MTDPQQDAAAPAPAAAESDLSEIQADRDKFKDLAYRAAAELENYKRRTAKEREELSLALKERFVSRLLPVLDTFELALALPLNDDVNDAIHKKYMEGYQAIHRQLLSTLESMGLTAVLLPPEAEFHPGEMEAVMTEDVPGLTSPMVMQVLQKGYRLDGRLIRPARVKVGMPKDKEVNGNE